jgi:hypothetical protein
MIEFEKSKILLTTKNVSEYYQQFALNANQIVRYNLSQVDFSLIGN